MEEKVKKLIKESLNRRLVGHGDIDTIYPNHVLIERWLTAIMALGYNDSDTELAAQDIYEMKSAFSEVSIEEIRAFVNLVNYRFPEEIMSFTKYAEMHEENEDSTVISSVQ